jgi:hypothetical protein
MSSEKGTSESRKRDEISMKQPTARGLDFECKVLMSMKEGRDSVAMHADGTRQLP